MIDATYFIIINPSTPVQDNDYCFVGWLSWLPALLSAIRSSGQFTAYSISGTIRSGGREMIMHWISGLEQILRGQIRKSHHIELVMDFFNWPVVILLSDCFLPTYTSSPGRHIWGSLCLSGHSAVCTDDRLHGMLFALIYAVG